MKSWKERPTEIANLLNPAFCCVTLTSTVIGYTSEDKQEGLSLPLAFIALPTVLHKATRESLPYTTRTPLATWLQEQAHVRVQFYERVCALKPYTREAILFGVLHKWLTLDRHATINTTMSNSSVNRFSRKLEGEARECVMRARVVGKWFALAGTPQTVMALWGIKP
jgi:hypothetical protein